jgi:DNA-binding transcriptional ArsR family regulator
MVAREMSGPERRQALTVQIEARPAYEFLMWLCVFTDMGDETNYEIGRAWFEAIRQKLSPLLLETIEQFSFYSHEMWEHISALAYTCPPPRDVPTLFAYLESIDPFELRLHMLGYYVRQHRRVTSPEVIYAAAQGDLEAQRKLIRSSFPEDTSWQKSLRWILSLEPTAAKERLLEIVHGWYNEVFREQEERVVSILMRDVEARRAAQATLTPEQLIEACTGWEYVPEPGIRRVILVPSYILRPFNGDAESGDTRIFYFPVADESINADASAPPERLMRMAKALADERRLRILRKLSGGSYTLQEIADDLGAAKTTIHHHLILLRSAGLVRMRMSDKRYSLRQDAFDHLEDLLKGYLQPPTG